MIPLVLAVVAAQIAGAAPLKSWVYFTDKACLTRADYDAAVAGLAATYEGCSTSMTCRSPASTSTR
jgi:hypothetical protein